MWLFKSIDKSVGNVMVKVSFRSAEWATTRAVEREPYNIFNCTKFCQRDGNKIMVPSRG